ncbi:MAG: AAA family ATPase [Pseudanabaena sp. ELA645]|jgi:predicted ATP-dependent endonuclease of OLD family
MHLQRVQVPDFRVLKDVDITFEKDFNPRVFPLGSQNGGGKSTLLQLIFVLLHCSTNTKRLPALKNLVSNITLTKHKVENVLATIDIWDGTKTVNLEFFVCGDNYINTPDQKNVKSFSLFTELKDLNKKISNLKSQEEKLKKVIQQFKMSKSNPFRSHFENPIDTLERDLLSFNIDFESIQIAAFDTDFLSKIGDETNLKLLHERRKAEIESAVISESIDTLIETLKLNKTKFITTYSSQEDDEIKAILCRVDNLDMEIADQFLNDLSNKIFLSAPSTQVFLFLPKKTIKSLFNDKNNYQSELTGMNSNLSGLFTYDFLATDILIEAFEKARDKDFKEALKTGDYGNNYKKLLQDLDFLLHDKQVNLTDDFSGLTFKLDRFKDSIELYPEDLSHGELKRLSIYVWLKYQNIEDAIVLMDEVDLALHPDWQYQIVSDLVEWSPSNQYILATHSYELCQALTPSHVKVLEPKLTERRSD